ncbi:MAG: hypothetical protein RLZZ127_1113 [Planctomycetota bacterium]
MLAVAVVGLLLMGGLTLAISKVFNVPLFGTLLWPVKLVFMIVLGFCIAYTLNGLLAQATGMDLRERLAERIDR